MSKMRDADMPLPERHGMPADALHVEHLDAHLGEHVGEQPDVPDGELAVQSR